MFDILFEPQIIFYNSVDIFLQYSNFLLKKIFICSYRFQFRCFIVLNRNCIFSEYFIVHPDPQMALHYADLRDTLIPLQKRYPDQYQIEWPCAFYMKWHKKCLFWKLCFSRYTFLVYRH